MTALITYAGKGSGLTYGEMDQNWNTLETRTGAGWNDLVSDVTIHTGTNAPNWSNYRDGLYGFAFSPDVMNECFVNFHLRHDYVDGTMVYPHVHWTHNTTNTGTVRWGVEWTFARRGDAGSGTIDFGPTQTLYIEHNIDSAVEQQAEKIPAFRLAPAVTGPSVYEQVQQLIALDPVSYTKARHNSRERVTKQRKQRARRRAAAFLLLAA